jgi:cytochrome c oxidase subunit 2
MLSKLGLIPEQASSLAGRVDALYLFLIGVTVFFTALIAVLVIGFAVRFRRARQGKAEQIHGNTALEIAWTGIPFAIAMVIFVWSAQIYLTIAHPPADALEIFVVGKQWMWKLQHMEGRREINELHVPAGRPIKLTMTSEDVIHSFYVPAFRVKQDVLPGRYTTLWFEATKPGTYHLFCTEYCGTEHSLMIGQVVVLEPHEYADWLVGKGPGAAAQATGAAPAAGEAGPSMAELGKAAFERAACMTCHSVKPEEDAMKVVGPPLHGIYGHTAKLLTGEEVVVDDAYIRKSILEPFAQVVTGYPPAMPPYAGRVTEEEILQIIAYIKSLGAPASESAAAQPAH